MIRKEKEGVCWLEFEQFQGIAQIVHAVFLKTCDFTKSSTWDLVKNLLTLKQISSSQLNHGARIEIVPNDTLPKCDGIMTCDADCGLIVTHADCQVALFYDPRSHAIASVHCGWRGSVQNIYAKAVAKLKGCWSVKPENLLVCISPSLGPDHAEFTHFESELPEEFWPYQKKEGYFDFWAISKMQLEAVGVLPHHIEIAQICTYQEKEDFFSYRRDKKTGRHGTLIATRGFHE